MELVSGIRISILPPNLSTLFPTVMKISLGYLSLEAVDVSFRQHFVATLGVSFRGGGTGSEGGGLFRGLSVRGS